MTLSWAAEVELEHERGARGWSLQPALGLFGAWGGLLVVQRPAGGFGLFELLAHSTDFAAIAGNVGHSHTMFNARIERLDDAMLAAESMVLERHGGPLTWTGSTHLCRPSSAGALHWMATIIVPPQGEALWPVIFLLTQAGEDPLEHHHHDMRIAGSWVEAMLIADAWRPPADRVADVQCACGAPT